MEKLSSTAGVKRNSLRKTLLTAAAVATAVAFGLSAPEPFAFILVAALASLSQIFLAVAIHEAGHLLGGLLVGFRFRLVTIGPLRITLKGGKLRVEFWRGMSTLGYALSCPTETRQLRRRMVIFIGGGPLLSLLFGLVSFAAYLGFSDTWPGIASLVNSMVSVLLFVGSALPIDHNGMASDGAKLLILARGGTQAERYCAIAALGGMSVFGRRGRDLPDELVRAATALPDGTWSDAQGSMLAYYWALDRGDVADAGRYLDRALAVRNDYPIISRPALYREAAYFFARHRGDVHAARGFLEQSRGGLIARRHSELRAEAAVLLAEAAHEEALQKAKEGLAALRCPDGTYPVGDAVDLLRELASMAASRQPLWKPVARCVEAAPPTPADVDGSGQ